MNNNIIDVLNEKMHTLSQIEGKLQAVETAVQNQVAQIKQQANKDITTDVLNAERLRQEIEAVASSHTQIFGENKSIELAFGKLGYRYGQPKLLINDEKEALILLKKMSRYDCIIVKESIDKSAVKKDASLIGKIGGEIIQEEKFFLDVIPATEKYSYQVKIKVS